MIWKRRGRKGRVPVAANALGLLLAVLCLAPTAPKPVASVSPTPPPTPHYSPPAPTYSRPTQSYSRPTYSRPTQSYPRPTYSHPTQTYPRPTQPRPQPTPVNPHPGSIHPPPHPQPSHSQPPSHVHPQPTQPDHRRPRPLPPSPVTAPPTTSRPPNTTPPTPGSAHVPDVQGMGLYPAEDRLIGAGLAVGNVTAEGSNATAGTVLRTSPPSNSAVARGSAVNIVIAYPK